MVANLYNFVVENIVGQVPGEFEFIIPVIVIFIAILILYSVFSGFILLRDLLGGR